MEAYLRSLAPLLAGSRRARARLLVEIGDHLTDAISAKLDLGFDALTAEQQALAELGSPSTVAAHWQRRAVRVRRSSSLRIAVALCVAALAAVLGAAKAANGHRQPPAGRRPERVDRCSTAGQATAYSSTRITRVSGRTPSYVIASCAPGVSIAAMTASMSGTSMSRATRFRFVGSTNVRMFVTPSGPKNSSLFGEPSQ
jgi:hypothetical protein